MPTLYILRGMPCSGKSTWAASYNETKNLSCIISRDAIRIELNPQGKYKFDPKVEDVVTATFKKRFEKSLDWGFDIYVDNTNLRPKYYNWMIFEAKEKGYTVVIKNFPISLWKAQYRNIMRWMKTGKWIPWKVMKDMYKAYKKLTNE